MPQRGKYNRMFGVWIRNDLYEWFIEYLERTQPGVTRSERFRQFLYALKNANHHVDRRLEDSSIQKREAKSPLEDFTREWICIRGLPKHPNPAMQVAKCDTCKARDWDEWKACQELRREARRT